MILDEIMAKKRIRLEQVKKELPLEALKERLRAMHREGGVSFKEALKKEGVSIIAEVKKASPSKGLISKDFSPSRIAAQYEMAGASAISVLTEEDFFLGSPLYLESVKSFVQIPVLRKDFIIDAYQVYEAALLRADAILLIAGLLNERSLRDFRELAASLHMDTLVEAHNEEEARMAVTSGAQVIGINNRDLKTFRVALETTKKLRSLIPPGIVTVSESGIRGYRDMQTLQDTGVDAVLIGETLMRAPSIRQKMAELKGECRDLR